MALLLTFRLIVILFLFGGILLAVVYCKQHAKRVRAAELGIVIIVEMNQVAINP